MTGTEEFSFVEVKQLATMLKQPQPPLLLDTLPKSHYQQAHLPGAMNACVFEVSFLDQVAEAGGTAEAQIVVYGSSDQTYEARTAADKLQRAGYQQIAILRAGMQGWRTAGLELQGDAPEQTPEAPAKLRDGSYRVATDQSLIEWAGRNPNSTHTGTLRLAGGELSVAGGKIEGRFEIDMRSIENTNLAGDELQPVLVNHLKSDDFFFIERFPKAVFSMTATPLGREQPASAPNYQITGQLSLCDVTAEQSFPATVSQTENGQLVAVAHFDFDRTRWGVIYGSSRFFAHLGMHLVFDLISLQIRIVAE